MARARSRHGGHAAEEATRLRAEEGALSRLPFAFSHPEKVLFPETPHHRAFTKADVAAYYAAVAERILPHLRGRPLVLRRYPKGIGAEPFFQKDVAHEVPDAVWKLPVWSESREAAMQYVVVENVEALVWLVQMDCIEIHPWLSRVGDCATCCGADAEGLEGPACGLDHPDVLAFDIDPYVREGRLGHRPTEAGGEPGVSDEDFRKALEVAALLRHNLDDLGLRSWPKTSGKRGLHIYIPLEPNHNYTQVRAFAKTLAAFFVREHPDLATIEYAKEARAGRVFLDYNQNVRGKTLAAPLSLRPTPEATVSMPLSWKDIPSANPLDFTLETVPGALGSKKDPWADFAPQRIEAAIRRGSPETESRLH